MTRHQLAQAIIYEAIEHSVGGQPTSRSPSNVDTRLLRDVIPGFEPAGREVFSERVTVASRRRGISLRHEMPLDVTVSGAIMAVAASLPIRLFRCSDKVETHVYETFGDGKCRIDDTELVELTS
jgi:hypothetical protein